jgi:hypothetical protein
VLKRMADLIRIDGRNDWANALEKCREEIKDTPNFTATKILSMYGGMGSLNDLVLYKNGQLLMAENNEFDMLRTELYELCWAGREINGDH